MRHALPFAACVCLLVLAPSAPAPAQDRPEICVYRHRNFAGVAENPDNKWCTLFSYNFIGEPWNDDISAIVVQSGTWRFCLHSNMRKPCEDLGPGTYPWVEDVNIKNDAISSWELLSR